MADAGDYECRLLADLLPTCVLVADFFASSDDAAELRIGAGAFTFYQNLHYEFCRLQAGQILTDEESLTVLGVGVIPVLEMLESRTARTSIRPTWLRKGTFDGLETLRSKVCGQALKIEELRQRLRLNTSSPRSRKYIIQCLTNCNPELPSSVEHLQGIDNCISGAKASKSPILRVSRLATRSHQLLCKNWACTCLPPGSHVEAKLLLTTYRSNKSTNTMRFELLLSTPNEKCPWQETEIDVVVDATSIVDNDMIASEKESSQISPVDKLNVQDPKVRFAAAAGKPESKIAGPKAERWKVENICRHVQSTLGTRFRLLVEGNSMWRLRPTRPKIKDLKKAVHISLSDLIRNGFLQRSNQKDMFLLTYIIATSILSLYQGPWLDHAWTKAQIVFLSQDGDLATIDLSKPLLSTKCIDLDRRASQPHPDNIHPEPRLEALGIVMLEIALGKAIESQRDDGPLNSNTDLLNAYQMLDQMREDRATIPNHILAIQTCLQPEDLFEEDISNESKQQRLHANIVGPLEAILVAYGIRTEDLDTTLGGDQETSLPVPRIPMKPRRPSTRSTQSVDLGLSISISPGLAVSPPADVKTALDSNSAEKWFQDLQTYVLPLVLEEPMRKVKIAILDSGIDLPNEVRYAYEDRLTYRSWIEGDNSAGTDICGHGTHAAGLLLRASSHAEIFAARVTQNGELNPDIIAKAIRYAVDEWEVDIIVMSFGFPKLEPTIDNSLIYAASKETILLAAASNSGNRHSITWPARAEHVICIHSLHGDGDHSSYTPNSRSRDYGILGQAVSSYWPPQLNAGISVSRSGTSCAAAIAAGVASLVLEYAWEKLPLYARADSKVDKHVTRRLRSNAGMRMIFGLMAENRDGQNCIIPWSLLSCERRENTMCDIILEKLRNM